MVATVMHEYRIMKLSTWCLFSEEEEEEKEWLRWNPTSFDYSNCEGIGYE